MIKIAPSILSADFANLAQEIKAAEEAGADMIHIDVMDGHFVPNLTIGPSVIKSIRSHTKLPFDVHLMISAPEKSIEQYVSAGANIITIHPEATIHLDRTLNQIKNLGVKAGISLLPSSPPSLVDYVMDKLDLILVMTVNPGFGGQNFMSNQLDKIRILADKIIEHNSRIMLAVDGGINAITAKKCIKAGANVLVAGSYIFSEKNYQERIMQLRMSS